MALQEVDPSPDPKRDSIPQGKHPQLTTKFLCQCVTCAAPACAVVSLPLMMEREHKATRTTTIQLEADSHKLLHCTALQLVTVPSTDKRHHKSIAKDISNIKQCVFLEKHQLSLQLLGCLVLGGFIHALPMLNSLLGFSSFSQWSSCKLFSTSSWRMDWIPRSVIR